MASRMSGSILILPKCDRGESSYHEEVLKKSEEGKVMLNLKVHPS